MKPFQEPSNQDLDDIESTELADSLSALWAERSAPARKSKPASAVRESWNSTYSNPENWKRTRGIALIHQETQTLLGNFSEYIHRTVKGCRKLLREEGPLAVEAAEAVSGSWWLGEERKPVPRESWMERRSATMHLHLPALQIHAPACGLVVLLEYGGIRRAELAEDTLFAAEAGGSLISLPAGLDIYPAMDHDGKVRLRMEIGL